MIAHVCRSTSMSDVGGGGSDVGVAELRLLAARSSLARSVSKQTREQTNTSSNFQRTAKPRRRNCADALVLAVLQERPRERSPPPNCELTSERRQQTQGQPT